MNSILHTQRTCLHLNKSLHSEDGVNIFQGPKGAEKGNFESTVDKTFVMDSLCKCRTMDNSYSMDAFEKSNTSLC